ncbi:MAG: zf-TFIIB domain-containing protein [Gammaproteobacteria bacterium]|nr:zf-TFIIB domain-containing protein [Gammaproteobacteria bacterium]
MNCPKCHSSMETVSFSELPVQSCTGCQGLWFRSHEFQKMKKDDWLAGFIDKGPTKTAIKHDKLMDVKCPDCGSRMKHLTDEKQPHILYEECPKDCGVYFDAGEFKDLAQTTFWDKFKTKKNIGKKK